MKKDALIEKLSDKNYHMIQDEESATVRRGKASFLNDHKLLVKMLDGLERTIKAEGIFINADATPVVSSIEGLALGKRRKFRRSQASICISKEWWHVEGIIHLICTKAYK